MEESILNTIKQLLGPGESYEPFNDDIVDAINSSMFILWQLGVGPKGSPFKITGPEEAWSDFVDEGTFEIVKDYIYNRVRLMFDPPSSSFLVENIDKQNAEFEWRMTVAHDEYGESQ